MNGLVSVCPSYSHIQILSTILIYFTFASVVSVSWVSCCLTINYEGEVINGALLGSKYFTFAFALVFLILRYLPFLWYNLLLSGKAC